jgi:hypothetical protein
MGVNTSYKDSVFSFLFSNPDTLRELYGALSGVTLPPEVPITINTLEGVLYRTLRNDGSWKMLWWLEREEGIEQGLEQGLEQGRTEGQNMVLELVRQGYSAEQIEARLAAGESSR